MRPSPVHSVKATSHRILGLTQCTARHSASAHAFCLVARQDRLGGFDFAQALSQFARAFHREARAHLSGVAQGAVLLIPKIQSSERAPTALRAAIADDDEFLPQAAFDLQPCFLPAGDIGGVGPLRNDSFESLGAGLFVHLRAIDGKMLAVAENRLV